MEKYLEQALQSKITTNKCKLCHVNLSSPSVTRQHCASKHHKNNVAMYLKSAKEEFLSSCMNDKNVQETPQRKDEKHLTENVPKVSEKFYCYPCKTYVYSKTEKDKHVQSFPHVLLVKLKSVLLKEGIVEEYWSIRGSEVICLLCDLMMFDSLGITAHINSIKHRDNYNNWCKSLPPCKVAIDIRWYYCKICDRDLDGTSESERHYSYPTHLKNSLLYCRICQVSSSTPELLEAHKLSLLHMDMLQKSHKPRGAPIKSCDSGTNKTERNPEALNTDPSSTPKQGKGKTTDLKSLEKSSKAMSSQRLLENALYSNEGRYGRDAKISNNSKPTEKSNTASSSSTLSHNEENSNASAVSNHTPELLEAHKESSLHVLQKSQKPIATWEQGAEQTGRGASSIKSGDSGTNETDNNPETLNTDPSSIPTQGKGKTNITTDLKSLGKNRKAVGSQQLMENAIYSTSSHYRLDSNISYNSKSIEKSSTASPSSTLNPSEENSNASAVSNHTPELLEAHKESSLHVLQKSQKPIATWEQGAEQTGRGASSIKSGDSGTNKTDNNPETLNTDLSLIPTQGKGKTNITTELKSLGKNRKAVGSQQLMENAIYSTSSHYRLDSNISYNSKSIEKSSTASPSSTLNPSEENSNISADSKSLEISISSRNAKKLKEEISNELELLIPKLYYLVTVPYEVVLDYLKQMNKEIDQLSITHSALSTADAAKQHNYKLDQTIFINNYMRRREPSLVPEEFCNYTDNAENDCTDHLQPAQLRLVSSATSKIVHNLDHPKAANFISDSEGLTQKHSSSTDNDDILILSDKIETYDKNTSATTIDTENAEDNSTEDIAYLNVMERKPDIEQDHPKEHSIEKEVLNENEYTDNYTKKDNLQSAQFRFVHTTMSKIDHNLSTAVNFISDSEELSQKHLSSADKAETVERNNSATTMENGEDKNAQGILDSNAMKMEKDYPNEHSIEKEVLNEMEIFLRQIGDGRIPLEEILRYLESVNDELQMEEFADYEEIPTGEDEKTEMSGSTFPEVTYRLVVEAFHAFSTFCHRNNFWSLL